MRRRTWYLGSALTLALLLGGPAAAAEDVELVVGAAAPPFDLPGSDGRNHTLQEYHGKSAVVIAWFPKAFTGG